LLIWPALSCATSALICALFEAMAATQATGRVARKDGKKIQICCQWDQRAAAVQH
jgi:hypothetical protein